MVEGAEAPYVSVEKLAHDDCRSTRIGMMEDAMLECDVLCVKVKMSGEASSCVMIRANICFFKRSEKLVYSSIDWIN